MSVAELMTDLSRLGIHLEVHGDRLRYSPRSAVTSDLVQRMKDHKSGLMEMLRSDETSDAHDSVNAISAWQMALDRLVGDLDFPSDVIEALRASDVDWADDEAREERIAVALEGCGHDPDMVIDPPDPCPVCERLELWQSLAGNWRCLRCDPPREARRLRKRAARLRSQRTNSSKRTITQDPLPRST